MGSEVRLVLAFAPLAIYFFLVGLWRSGRSPRVIPGPVDFGLLVFGIGGLVAFGPIGEAVVRALFPTPSVWAWLAVATSIWLLALLWAPRTGRRLVVYNVRRDALRHAIEEIAQGLPGHFAATLRGYEDASSGRGLAVDVGRARTATVEAYGEKPDAFIAAIAPDLRDRLRGAAPQTTVATAIRFALSTLCLLAPLTSVLLRRPEVREPLINLILRIKGG